MSGLGANIACCVDPKTNGNANLFGLFALLYRIDERNKREAMAAARIEEVATSEKKQGV